MTRCDERLLFMGGSLEVMVVYLLEGVLGTAG
jgi:hypothetical protein